MDKSIGNPVYVDISASARAMGIHCPTLIESTLLSELGRRRIKLARVLERARLHVDSRDAREYPVRLILEG